MQVPVILARSRTGFLALAALISVLPLANAMKISSITSCLRSSCLGITDDMLKTAEAEEVASDALLLSPSTRRSSDAAGEDGTSGNLYHQLVQNTEKLKDQDGRPSTEVRDGTWESLYKIDKKQARADGGLASNGRVGSLPPQSRLAASLQDATVRDWMPFPYQPDPKQPDTFTFRADPRLSIEVPESEDGLSRASAVSLPEMWNEEHPKLEPTWWRPGEKRGLRQT